MLGLLGYFLGSLPFISRRLLERLSYNAVYACGDAPPVSDGLGVPSARRAVLTGFYRNRVSVPCPLFVENPGEEASTSRDGGECS